MAPNSHTLNQVIVFGSLYARNLLKSTPSKLPPSEHTQNGASSPYEAKPLMQWLQNFGLGAASNFTVIGSYWSSCEFPFKRLQNGWRWTRFHPNNSMQYHKQNDPLWVALVLNSVRGEKKNSKRESDVPFLCRNWPKHKRTDLLLVFIVWTHASKIYPNRKGIEKYLQFDAGAKHLVSILSLNEPEGCLSIMFSFILFLVRFLKKNLKYLFGWLEISSSFYF
jgi:hypothetical protein